jgi:hypothetical protein
MPQPWHRLPPLPPRRRHPGQIERAALLLAVVAALVAAQLICWFTGEDWPL